MSSDLQIRHLEPAAIRLISEIDRSEHVDVAYQVVDGELVARSVDWDVPSFDPVGTGDHSVHRLVETWGPVAAAGAHLMGAYAAEQLAGLAMIDTAFEPGRAWLCLLHVSRTHRRRGVASVLWDEAVKLAAAARSTSMYVSATQSRSAVGFYLSRGCRLIDEPHPFLHAKEPEDIHLTYQITQPDLSA